MQVRNVSFFPVLFCRRGRLIVLCSANPLGVFHGADLAYVTKVATAPIAKVINDYFTSCKPVSHRLALATDSSISCSVIVAGDPNALVPSSYPKWPNYDLNDPQELTLVDPGADVRPDSLRKEQMDFWLSNPEVFPH